MPRAFVASDDQHSECRSEWRECDKVTLPVVLVRCTSDSRLTWSRLRTCITTASPGLAGTASAAEAADPSRPHPNTSSLAGPVDYRLSPAGVTLKCLPHEKSAREKYSRN